MIVFGEIADGTIGEFTDAIAVRIIRRDQQIIGADMLDIDQRQLFAGFATRPALPFEIVARFFFGRLGLAMPLMFPVFIHAFQPKRHPAAARFQMGDFEVGKLFQDAVGAKI